LLRPYYCCGCSVFSIAAVMLVSGLDSVFTYLSKRMVDEGITAGNWEALLQIVSSTRR
jgi:hypothetical protein